MKSQKRKTRVTWEVEPEEHTLEAEDFPTTTIDWNRLLRKTYQNMGWRQQINQQKAHRRKQ